MTMMVWLMEAVRRCLACLLIDGGSHYY